MNAFWIALALLLVIEGLTPMLLPKQWQNMLRDISQLPPEKIRTYGGVMVTIGAVSLFFLL